MDREEIESFKKAQRNMSTDELLTAWEEHDDEEWSKGALISIKELLHERGVLNEEGERVSKPEVAPQTSDPEFWEPKKRREVEESEEDGPTSKSMLHEAIEEAKRTTKQRSRSGASLAPAEQGQTADLTGIQFVPFTPSVKLGFKDMRGIATQLNKAVSDFEAKGVGPVRQERVRCGLDL